MTPSIPPYLLTHLYGLLPLLPTCAAWVPARREVQVHAEYLSKSPKEDSGLPGCGMLKTKWRFLVKITQKECAKA
jgi:hypothetical protein